ncbi:mechanosensitive ion channel [Microcystis elabens FACHB-917]|nr:mechanosensitive ion channel [Microcystis elabens FACHB-917]
MSELVFALSAWVALLLRPQVIGQWLPVVLLMLGYGLLVRRRMRRRCGSRWLVGFAGLCGLLYLLVWALGAFGLPMGLARDLAWINLLWGVLILLRLLLSRTWGLGPTDRLYLQVVKPAFLVGVLLFLGDRLNSLDEVGAIGLLELFGRTYTVNDLLIVLLFPYFLVVLSGLLVNLIRGLLQTILDVSDSSLQVLALLLRYLIVGLGFLWLFNVLGLSGTPLAALVGGLSVGLGFGIKEVFSNFVSGVWLLFEGSVRPGDVLFIDGDPCMVRRMGLRAATLWRQRDNAELVIPNQVFFTNQTTTYTGTDRMRRGQVAVSAAYRHVPSEVIALLEATARSMPRVLREPAPRAYLISYGDSGINYVVRYGIADPLENLGISSELSDAVWKAFEAYGIEIPFPQRVVHPAGGGRLEEKALDET